MAVALFVAAHPDDETLGMGVPLVEHVVAGLDVHVLILTRSTNSGVLGELNGTGLAAWWGVQHDPAGEGYAPLDEDVFGAARMAEARAAVRALACGLGTITLHEGGMDPHGGWTAAQAQAVITAKCDELMPGGPVRLKAHSHLVDDHPDHIAVGQAVRAMKAADPARFSDLRHYILPRYWADARLSQVEEHWDTPTDATVSKRVINACRAYGAWSPSQGSYAIGFHSVYADMFAPLLATPKAMFHP